MKSVEFCYWLQGFFEISGNKDINLTSEQVSVIQKHLNMVFIHEIDSSYPVDQQPALNAAHNEPVQKKNFLGMTEEEYEKAGRPRC